MKSTGPDVDGVVQSIGLKRRAGGGKPEGLLRGPYPRTAGTSVGLVVRDDSFNACHSMT